MNRKNENNEVSLSLTEMFKYFTPGGRRIDTID